MNNSKLLYLKVVRETLCALETLAIASSDDIEIQDAIYNAIDNLRPLIYRKEERIIESSRLMAVVGG